MKIKRLHTGRKNRNVKVTTPPHRQENLQLTALNSIANIIFICTQAQIQ